MKKTLIVTAVILAALVTLGIAGFAYAQSQTPPTPPTGTYGPGMMGGRGAGGPGMMGRWGGGGMLANGAYGPMHEYMVAAVAQALGLDPADVQSRLEAGETMWQIAQSQGLNDAEIAELMSTAHQDALQAAVAAGVITQEQADWMSQHMQQRWQNGGAGAGSCHGGRGPRGRWNTQPAEPSI